MKRGYNCNCNQGMEIDLIRTLVYEGKVDEAIALLDKIIADDPTNEEAFFIRGNAYRKKSDWQHALNNYLEAIEINPESPAKHAYEMLIKILDFYNKDMYNH
ncbi:tetratricopeptide repeat protein [Parabacteroides pacaensis]|uniref:tetratricopeptide repeat protein n=1 Tax=Parabacteroides pacaensis TaxID=2086575 RepID=UPI003744AF45